MLKKLRNREILGRDQWNPSVDNTLPFLPSLFEGISAVFAYTGEPYMSNPSLGNYQQLMENYPNEIPFPDAARIADDEDMDGLYDLFDNLTEEQIAEQAGEVDFVDRDDESFV